ncbi:MAG TPA: GatB/YqeY domain-containing protein [Thermodesulfobacteriota bacterium]|nr:GatB/YqeY domain-containing protein [Thermodesulfobacteriota bacterium]
MAGPLIQEIEDQFKAALKSQDKLRLSALRMLRAAIKNKTVERRAPLEDQDIVTLLRGMIRQGKEAVEQFEKGGRPDLAEKEKAEMEIYTSYLPAQASTSEIEETISRVIEEVQAAGLKDMGKVMKAAMSQLAGRADGQTIQALVKQKLSSV